LRESQRERESTEEVRGDLFHLIDGHVVISAKSLGDWIETRIALFSLRGHFAHFSRPLPTKRERERERKNKGERECVQEIREGERDKELKMERNVMKRGSEMKKIAKGEYTSRPWRLNGS
jgi:hypothetical protein